MANEFNAKNGLRIGWGQPITGITNTTLIEDDYSLATEGQIYRELTGKTDNTTFYSYTANTASEISGITHSTYSDNNQNMSGLTTSSDGDLATNTAIIDIPSSRVRVFISGLEVNVGDGLDCYFADPTTPTVARIHGSEEQGDKLYWNGSVAGLQLDSLDIIDFVYLIDGVSTVQTVNTTFYNTASILTVDELNSRQYTTFTGGTGNVAISFNTYPTASGSKLVIIKNIRGTDATIILPTGNVVDGGITYKFISSIADITVVNNKYGELHLRYQYIDATNIEVHITGGNFDNISS